MKKTKIVCGFLLALFLVYGFFVKTPTAVTDASLTPDAITEAREAEETAAEMQELADAREEKKEDLDISSLPDYQQAAYPWYDQLEDPETLILTSSQIEDYNSDICSDTANRNVLRTSRIPDAETIQGYLNAIDITGMARYNEGAELSDKKVNKILNKMDIENVDEDVELGIVTTRTDVRLIPTELHFYATADDESCDQLQVSTLICSDPVWILHHSSDDEWYYVQSYTCRGWVKAENIAIAESKSVWKSFAAPDQATVITAAQVQIQDAVVDMGAAFLTLEEGTEEYSILLPTRDEYGNLKGVEASVPIEDASQGYLDYTAENFFSELMRFDAFAYGYHGTAGGLDDTGLILSLGRVFDIKLPLDLDGWIEENSNSLVTLDIDDPDTNFTFEAPVLMTAEDGTVSILLGKTDEGWTGFGISAENGFAASFDIGSLLEEERLLPLSR